jgi:regulator of replication initiation timing
VKILAKFLLSSVFVFLPTVCCAQYGLYGDCPFPPRGVYTIERDNATIVNDLENGQNCLNDGLKELKLDVENLQSPLKGNDNLKTEILELQNQLAQTKLDLRMEETKIETLQNSYDKLTHLFDRMLYDRLNNSGLSAHKPTAPASKPTSGFIPDTPAITPHAASKKSDASKPKTTYNKPGKPTAPANNPTPAVKEGTH